MKNKVHLIDEHTMAYEVRKRKAGVVKKLKNAPIIVNN
jgi:hypothetical protein